VPDAEDGFAGMAEGSVPDVVQEERDPEQAALPGDVGLVGEELPSHGDQLVEGPRPHGERPQGMGKPRVFG
jgi:hypothetical protein